MQKLIFLLLVLISPVFSQDISQLRLSFNHLTQQSGLSNNNVTNIYSDSRAYVWISTLNGLNKFDGIKNTVFKPYNSALKGVVPNNIVEDTSGNLWIGSEEALNFYDRKKDAFRSLKIKSFNSKYLAFPILLDENENLWVVLTNNNRSAVYIFKSKENLLVKMANIPQWMVAYVPIKLWKNPIKVFYTGNERDEDLIAFTFKKHKLISTKKLLEPKIKIENIKSYLTTENDSISWLTGYKFGLLKLNTYLNKYTNYTAGLPQTTQLTDVAFYKNLILCASNNNGITVFDRKTERFTQSIKNEPTKTDSPTTNWSETMYLDPADNLFYGYGFDYTNINKYIAELWLSKKQIEPFNISENHVSFLSNNGDFTFAKLQFGGLLELDKNGEIVKSYKKHNVLFTDSKARTWLSDGSSFLIRDPLKNFNKSLKFKEFEGFQNWQISMVEIGDNEFLIFTPKGLFSYSLLTNKLKPELENKNLSFGHTVPVLYHKNSGQVLVSYNWWTNLIVISKINGRWQFKKDLSQGFQTYAIEPSIQKNKAWLCTNYGLKFLDLNSFSITTINESNGLPNDAVTDIIEEKNGDYWVTTNKGIAYYDKKLNTFKQYTVKDGAYSREYGWGNAFKLKDGRVVFGGTEGITLINPKISNEIKVKPKTQITNILVNEKPYLKTGNVNEAKIISLKPNENSIAIEITAIDYAMAKELKIKYKLEGFDKEWISIPNANNIRYTDLKEGSYELKYQVLNSNNQAVTDIKNMPIYIQTPFQRTLWFRALMVLSLVGLGIIFYRIRVKQIRKDLKKKEEIKRIKAEAEINALRSQMNPHFIFNCLNTIDSYILLNKVDEASSFLNKFSKLIRRILENSRDELIYLNHELEALELYIKLEQERSQGSFDYKIRVKKDLFDKNVFVPTMLLQPYIENAIIHGLRNRPESTGGFLEIDVSATKDSISVHIKDNGVGILVAQQIESMALNKKTSLGMKVSNERIIKLNEIYQDKIKVEVLDLKNDENTGTEVIITLPFIKENKFNED